MSAINTEIERIASGIIECVSREGGTVAVDGLMRALNPDGSERVAKVVLLAVERAIGLRKIESCGPGLVRAVQPACKPDPKDMLRMARECAEAKRRAGFSARPRTEKPPKGMHRLKRRGQLIRKGIVDALGSRDAVMSVREILGELPDDARPNSKGAFQHQLKLLLMEGQVLRIAIGQYALSSREAQAREAYAKSKDEKYRRRKERKRAQDPKRRRPARKKKPSPRPTKVFRTPKPHRLHVRGKALRSAVLNILLKGEGAAQSRSILESLPSELRPHSASTFDHLLYKMCGEGVVERLGMGWYCHPDFRDEARRQYMRYRKSRQPSGVGEKIRAEVTGRRETIVAILSNRTEPIWVTELHATLKALVQDVSYRIFHRDLKALRDEGRVAVTKRGWYCHPNRLSEMLERDGPHRRRVPKARIREPGGKICARRREDILEILRECREPASKRKLFSSLRARGYRESKDIIYREINALLRQRRIVRPKRGYYRLSLDALEPKNVS